MHEDLRPEIDWSSQLEMPVKITWFSWHKDFIPNCRPLPLATYQISQSIDISLAAADWNVISEATDLLSSWKMFTDDGRPPGILILLSLWKMFLIFLVHPVHPFAYLSCAHLFLLLLPLSLRDGYGTSKLIHWRKIQTRMFGVKLSASCLKLVTKYALPSLRVASTCDSCLLSLSLAPPYKEDPLHLSHPKPKLQVWGGGSLLLQILLAVRCNTNIFIVPRVSQGRRLLHQMMMKVAYNITRARGRGRWMDTEPELWGAIDAPKDYRRMTIKEYLRENHATFLFEKQIWQMIVQTWTKILQSMPNLTTTILHNNNNRNY